jgi:glutamate decarboxylase
MEVTESLIAQDSPMHALSTLKNGGKRNGSEHQEGKIDEGHSSAPSGTYAKTC